MFTLSVTESHYIRCIKPNRQSSAGKFDAVYIHQQLEACGVVETVDISRRGYPTRSSIPLGMNVSGFDYMIL